MLPKNFICSFPHLDVAGNVRATDELVQIMSKAYDAQFPALIGRTLLAQKAGVSPGADKLRVQHFERTGNAEVLVDLATYAPKVNLIQTETEFPIRNIADGFGYTVQDLEADAFSRIDTTSKKAIAAREAIETRIDEILFYGHPTGLKGITNLANTNTFAAANPWSGVTWDVMLSDANKMVRNIGVNTLYSEKPNTMLIPPTIAQLMRDKIIPDTGGQSVMKRFEEENKDLKIIEVWRLETSGPSDKPQIIVYDDNPNKIEYVLPVDFQQLPPQLLAYTYNVFCRARIGGVASYYPKSVLYGSGLVA